MPCQIQKLQDIFNLYQTCTMEKFWFINMSKESSQHKFNLSNVCQILNSIMPAFVFMNKPIIAYCPFYLEIFWHGFHFSSGYVKVCIIQFLFFSQLSHIQAWAFHSLESKLGQHHFLSHDFPGYSCVGQYVKTLVTYMVQSIMKPSTCATLTHQNRETNQKLRWEVTPGNNIA